MVDWLVLETSDANRKGSSPFLDIKINLIFFQGYIADL